MPKLHKCNSCGQMLPASFFYFNKGKMNKPCKSCRKKADAKRRADPLVKARKNEIERQRRLAYRAQIFSALGNHCNRCGETDIRCLEIHHVGHDGNDAEEKALWGNPKSALKSVLLEPEKYELLCANCHRIHHHDAGVGQRPVAPSASSPY